MVDARRRRLKLGGAGVDRDAGGLRDRCIVSPGGCGDSDATSCVLRERVSDKATPKRVA